MTPKTSSNAFLRVNGLCRSSLRKVLGLTRRRARVPSIEVVPEITSATVEPLPVASISGAPAQKEAVNPRLERMLESVETTPKNEAEIIPILLASYAAARRQLKSVGTAYLPARTWQALLDAEWRNWRDVIAREDTVVLAGLLRKFFRNEGISGFWGGDRMFDHFCGLQGNAEYERSALMMLQFQAWRSLMPKALLEELDAPKIGDPWGYKFGDNVVFEPAFEYHYQASYFRSLLAHLQTPVVLEIGGGFGGLAYHILKSIPGAKYIGIDLPENILIQTYYLSCAFPQLRLLTYSEDNLTLNRRTLDAYDIILMPNFMLPNVESSLADLVVNVRSLSEMLAETIVEYLHQIDRIGRLWFFHENIFKARGDDLHGIPSTEFPDLENHVLISASETKWPRYSAQSSYPCRENLYIHRRMLADRAAGLE